MDKYIGKKLDGRYEITELIGIGGMAEVYKAVDLHEDRTVAVKILKDEYADNDDFVRRFRNESKAIAVLSHPNIVKIYDVGFTEKIQFIVMEYIDGITLKEFMEQQGVLRWKDSVHFIIQVLRALQHAHDRGIVHRDIKPQNIMLFSDGTIKVMDFGIARFAREEGKTISDKAIGSVHYISPEQARGDITDEKSDIYSVGIMLYEMLTGVKPFDGDSPIQIALQHMQQEPKPLRKINDTIPEALETIVLRAMQKDASKRYQSASEMIKDIEEFKKNPDIVFEYDIARDEGSGTKYFDKAKLPGKDEGNGKKSPSRRKPEDPPVKKKREEPEDEDDDDEDEEEEVSKSSYFVVALTAITAAIFIIAAIFVAGVLIKEFGNTSTSTQAMVSLVGHDYNECRSLYADYFELVKESEKYSSEYPAGTIISHTPKEGSQIIVGSTQVKAVVSKGPQMVNIPNVYSLEANTATSMIEDAGLKYTLVMDFNESVEENHVIRTEPERNSEAELGSNVVIYVSLGAEVYDVVMPDVVGMQVVDATRELEGKGFTVIALSQDSVEEENAVINQSIPHLTEDGQVNIVNPKQTVTITYSSGKVPMSKVNITIAIPENVQGQATFNAYVNGNLAGQQSFDNIGYAGATINIEVEGKDTQKVVLETVGADGHAHKLGEFNVDFNTKTVSQMEYDTGMLKTLYGIPEETTVTEATTRRPRTDTAPSDTGFVDPADQYYNRDGGNDTDWWEEITEGR
ncbi:MAG: Stk1 family PASTA domain-containing Ser/Thr kinase [Oscillospiraceae bacterium]|nr:Stk1 family PASTA domain-containing Ser/Thr kinase [Oscillospiraceae bacterium]